MDADESQDMSQVSGESLVGCRSVPHAGAALPGGGAGAAVSVSVTAHTPSRLEDLTLPVKLSFAVKSESDLERESRRPRLPGGGSSRARHSQDGSRRGGEGLGKRPWGSVQSICEA